MSPCCAWTWLIILVYVDGDSSVCLYPFIRRIRFFKALNNRIFSVEDKLSPWETTWLHWVCGKCYTYQYLSLPQMVPLDEWLLLPNNIASNCWCRTTYLPKLWCVDTNCVTMKMSKSYEIVRVAERQLLNECFGYINTSIELSSSRKGYVYKSASKGFGWCYVRWVQGLHDQGQGSQKQKHFGITEG